MMVASCASSYQESHLPRRAVGYRFAVVFEVKHPNCSGLDHSPTLAKCQRPDSNRRDEIPRLPWGRIEIAGDVRHNNWASPTKVCISRPFMGGARRKRDEDPLKAEKNRRNTSLMSKNPKGGLLVH